MDRRQVSPASPAPFFRRLPLPFPQVYALLQDSRGLYNEQTLLAQLALNVRSPELRDPSRRSPSQALGFLQPREPEYATTTDETVGLEVMLSVVFPSPWTGHGGGVFMKRVGGTGSFGPSAGHFCDSDALLCRSHIFHFLTH